MVAHKEGFASVVAAAALEPALVEVEAAPEVAVEAQTDLLAA